LNRGDETWTKRVLCGKVKFDPGNQPLGRESAAHPAFSIIPSLDFDRFATKLSLGMS
jgi:hypothetical protein